MVGQTVWKFDENHRVYAQRGADGFRTSGGPIWREHWVPRQITGETRVSWVTAHGDRIPKRNRDVTLWAFTQQEIDEREWVHVHKYKILDALRFVNDPAVFRGIAATIGYPRRHPWETPGHGRRR